jgi:multiple sugar transport system permease protein
MAAPKKFSGDPAESRGSLEECLIEVICGQCHLPAVTGFLGGPLAMLCGTSSRERSPMTSLARPPTFAAAYRAGTTVPGARPGLRRGILLYPAAYTLYVSLTDWDGLNPPKYIGFQNYSQFFDDPEFKTSFSNTLVWVGSTILFPVLWGLGMALLITRMRFEGTFKTIFYLPYAISATSTAVMWAFLLAPNGFINTVLHSIGLDAWARSWLISPPWHTAMMLAAYTWQTAGTNMVLFSVGLQTIPTEPVEAAKIDGANGWQTFRHVIFPLLAPIRR